MAKEKQKTTDQEDLLWIPPFLDRKLWTPEQFSANKAANDEICRQEQKRNLERYETEQAKKRTFQEQYQREQLDRELRRIERQKRREERKAKRALRAEITAKILTAMEGGCRTRKELRDQTGLDRKLIGRGLRLLVKQGKIVKIKDTKQYKFTWESSLDQEQRAKVKIRFKRTHLSKPTVKRTKVRRKK